MLKNLLFFLISIAASRSEEDFCDQKYFSFLIPGGVISEAKSLITSGGVRNNFGCRDYKNLPFKQQDLKFRLYTREYQTSDWLDLTTDNLVNLDRSKPTKIYLPGWLCGDATRATKKLIGNFLHRYDCNVITIDHRKFSYTYYKTTFCNLYKAAELLGDFLCEFGLDFDRIHLIGHSIGGQLAGFTGQRVKAKCNKLIDRITGLDPAGPIYQHVGRTQRLGKEDGRFVDVLHTNMGIYGYYGSLGHVDVYADGGMFQNLCCHTRSIEYFADSILGPTSMFQAESCTLTPKHLPVGTCLRNKNRKYITMGEDCERNSSTTEFIWKTKKYYAFFHG